MLPPKVQRLLEEVFGHNDKDRRKLAKNDPERCLVKLLEKIKENFGDVSAMLDSTVEEAIGEIDVEDDEEEERQEQARETRKKTKA